MSSQPLFEMLPCVHGPLDGAMEPGVAVSFVVPLHMPTMLNPNPTPGPTDADGPTPVHPGRYMQEQDGDHRIYKWHPDES